MNELEEAMRKKDQAVELLKARVANALRGFENQGLTVVQKNGRISLQNKTVAVVTFKGLKGLDVVPSLKYSPNALASGFPW